MAKNNNPTTATELSFAVEKIQQEHVATAPGTRPMTGVEIALLIGAEQPASAPPGTIYQLTPHATQGEPMSNAVKVQSPDGTVEDAVRQYNAIELQKKVGVVRTAKQLVIQRLAT